ncbi:oligopeptide transport system substrate-binding protein [Paenochrobactrum gallinarii]|uniref:Oligopeptide transport system substrate-binding protein n=1 Tax=Paenochrobactrum gallinarii TaxID=643673 RepID=A0A841LW10_9HYPH|nr:peptide ABC transporter substrate-binding protein [Paenochrobactrum gallinarii]MBB6260732.1 oligopeptide transport system substrate-binding protein [Paenochrobactrum gallinarii]
MYCRVLFALFFSTTIISSVSAETVLNRGNDADPGTLDQHHTLTQSEGRILADLYDGLVIDDAYGKPVPGAAQSWDISPDNLTYTFHLRKNGKWSNGDPVTAYDFSFAFHRIMDPKTAAGNANSLFAIKNAEEVASGKKPLNSLGVEALDALTLRINLEYPAPYFISLLINQTALPLHEKSVLANGANFTKPGKLVTNGAYKLISFTPNDKIILEKNQYYWNAENVKTDKINWYPFEDHTACLRRFEAHEIDSCSDLPASQIDYIRANLKSSLHITPSLGMYYLDVKGAADSKLHDKRVRQAISLVIDREFIADEVWRGTMNPAYSIVPVNTENYVKGGVELSYANEDMLSREDEATNLLKQAGVEPGSLSVELSYNSSDNHKSTLEAISNTLSKIGIKARLNEMEGATYFDYLRDDGAFDIAREGWSPDFNDPYAYLYTLGSGFSLNFTRWSNKTFDALLAKSQKTTDPQARAKILAEAERVVLDDLPIIPLLSYSSRALVSDRIAGWNDNINNSHPSRWLSVTN